VKRSSSAETAARFLAMRGVRAAVHRPRAARASVPASPPVPMRLHARPEALAARGVDTPSMQAVAVPADYIVYVSKISRGRLVKIPLPDDLTRADVERLYAVMLTCTDDEEAPTTPRELVTLDSHHGPIERVVLEDRGAVVVVCRPEELAAAVRERRRPRSVGFPKTAITGRRPYAPERPNAGEVNR
jgi:hypothetical protein